LRDASPRAASSVDPSVAGPQFSVHGTRWMLSSPMTSPQAATTLASGTRATMTTAEAKRLPTGPLDIPPA
jgi:hypothetical protein